MLSLIRPKNSEAYLLSLRVLGIFNSNARFGTGTSFARAMTISSN